MKILFNVFRYVAFLACMLLSLTACQKEEAPSETPEMGAWSGTDISFEVTGNPPTIVNLSFSYSGHATGSTCSFDYQSSASLSYPIAITDNAFSKVSGSYEIQGVFTSDSEADLTISWTGYDSNCGANYSGSRTYHATKNR